ncbi:MAG: polyhydroxyalkanoate synthesis regulator DNA-binding domain-containing protein [Phycisphaerae bacterium]
MSDNPPNLLRIKKYPNRRFYDTTNGGHLTLDDLHQRIADGFDVQVTDSKTGEDITNVILTQMLLDRHAAKLAIFPTPVLHQMIRTQQQFLGGVMEEFFKQTVAAQHAAQENWAKMLRGMFPGMPTPPQPPPGPMDWARGWFPGAMPTPPAAPPDEPHAEPPDADEDLAALKKQVEALQQQLREIASRGK